MAVVVSDTSPVRALAHLGHLTWLEVLFQDVLVPPAVAAELENPPASLPAVHLQNFPYLRTRNPTNRQRVSELTSLVDCGEAEAIVLAEELGANTLLIDERAGREVAQKRGLTVVGTLSILLSAKQHGLCLQIRPLLDRLQMEIRFFVSKELRTIVLEKAQERDG